MIELKVVIIGAGKVGTAFAKEFVKKKIKIGAVIDRNINKAKKLGKSVNSEIYSSDYSKIPQDANFYLIAVQDRFIKDVANELSIIIKKPQKKFVCHVSGSLTSDELSVLNKKGCRVFSLHPNFSFVTERLNQKFFPLNKAIFALEGNSSSSLRFGKFLCKKMSWKFILISRDQKALYHAFSVLISNYLVSLLFQVEQRLGKNFVGSYVNLIKSTIQNIETFGVKNSLSGPIVRGDEITIKKNIETLSKEIPELEKVYQKLGKLTKSLIHEKQEK